MLHKGCGGEIFAMDGCGEHEIDEEADYGPVGCGGELLFYFCDKCNHEWDDADEVVEALEDNTPLQR